MAKHFEEKETHPSYARIQISRVTGSKRPLFGSSIVHGETIRIRIKRASITRESNKDWIFDADGDLIEVEMSPVQFAELLTSHGTGVPCTVLYIGREEIEDCPYRDVKQKHEDDFRARIAGIAALMDAMGSAINEMQSAKSIKKSDLERIAGMFRNMRQDIASNLPFAAKCFSEFIEHATMEAKSEIEAHMLHRALRMAQEGMKFVEQLEGENEGPIVQIGEDSE